MEEVRSFASNSRSRAKANSRWARRSPRLEPRAMATLARSGTRSFNDGVNYPITRYLPDRPDAPALAALFDPSRGKHFADARPDRIRPAAEELGVARGRLLEESLL